MVFDVQEYAKQKGIPVGSIPVGAVRKAEKEGYALRSMGKDSKAETFKKLCYDTKDVVDKCMKTKKSDDTFPEACVEVGMKHMECLINKREQAMAIAIQLAGNDKVTSVFPYYEDNKKKAVEMLELYKTSGDSKKDVFWG